jgi:hypothetical protein
MPSISLENPGHFGPLGQPLELRRQLEVAFAAVRSFIETSKAGVVLLKAVDPTPAIMLRTGATDQLSWVGLGNTLFPNAHVMTEVEREAYRDFRRRRALKKK